MEKDAPKESAGGVEQPISSQKPSNKKEENTGRKSWYLGAFVWMLVVVALAVGLGVGLSKSNSQEDAPPSSLATSTLNEDKELSSTGNDDNAQASSSATTTPEDATEPSSTESTTESAPEHYLDYSCQEDCDCEVMDVGNCCGYYPECVHKSSTPDPAKGCPEGEDGMGICGFVEIESCICEDGRCSAVEM